MNIISIEPVLVLHSDKRVQKSLHWNSIRFVFSMECPVCKHRVEIQSNSFPAVEYDKQVISWALRDIFGQNECKNCGSTSKVPSEKVDEVLSNAIGLVPKQWRKDQLAKLLAAA